MALLQGAGDLSVFTWDANSLLAILPDVSYEIDIDYGDTSVVGRPGDRQQAVKRGAVIQASIYSTLASDSGLVASNLAISAFTIGGTSYLAHVRGGSFKGSFKVRETSGVGDVFKWPQIFGKGYTAEVNLTVPLTGSPNIIRNISSALHDTDLLDQDLVRVAFSITIDGTPITVPMTIKSMKVNWQNQQEVNVTLSLEGNDPSTGDYPTAPTGTSTLLENAFNQYNTSIAMVLTTSAVVGDGTSFAFNAIITNFGFSFNDAEIIKTDYTFSSRGNVTPTNN